MKRSVLSVLMGFALLLLSSTGGWSLPVRICETIHPILSVLGKCPTAVFDKTVIEWKRLAEKGNTNAQYNLGYFLWDIKMEPSEKDRELAITLLERSAENGNVNAQYRLYRVFIDKEFYWKGEKDDEANAEKWLERAAQGGHVRAQLEWGVYNDYNYSGDGKTKSYSTAMSYYQRTAKLGASTSRYRLGYLYEFGHGGTRSLFRAAKWYKLAAEQGLSIAQVRLGYMYASGNGGVPQDYVLAYKWLNLSTIYGIRREHQKEFFYRFKELKSTMTPSQIEEAQRLARNFVPKENLKTNELWLPKTTPPNPKPPVIAKTKPKKTKKRGGSGSGFFVSRMGHVITNAHVVKGCKRITIGDNANKQTTVELVSTDKKNDLALLKFPSDEKDTKESKSLIEELGIGVYLRASHGLLRVDDVKLGEEVMVAGYPFGPIFKNMFNVTTGIVSATRGIGDDSGWFQLDAAVQRGNSGGPIYDQKGNVVGVVVAQLNKENMQKLFGVFPENVNFGIKASSVRTFLDESGLPKEWSTRSTFMSTEERAKIAESQTVMVMCSR